ncbi:MAG: Sll0314/Alr1548 family TPR repeat-containing protein [Cyanophyceae cyanobacterium]
MFSQRLNVNGQPSAPVPGRRGGGRSPKGRHRAIALAVAALTLWSTPALAGDPFRTTNPYPISDRTETAFRTLFEQGNYPEARRLATEALARDPKEPLLPAMLAAIAYLYEDRAAISTYAEQTLSAAAQLKESAPLRAELYQAVGEFMQGAATFSEGGLEAIPAALGKVGEVRQSLARARAIAPDDPELNLIAGLMDIVLAVYLPFGNVERALATLDRGAPPYLVERGRAVAYRRLDQDAEALAAVDRAIALTPNNPELWHLKAQLLYSLGEANKDVGQLQQSVALFEQVLVYEANLPPELIDHLKDNELRRARRAICRIQTGADRC